MSFNRVTTLIALVFCLQLPALEASAETAPAGGDTGAASEPAAAVVPAVQHSGWSFSEARLIPLQGGGRIKPLDSFSRETVLFLTGSPSFKGWQPIDLIFSIISNPHYWDSQAFITITRPDLRRQLGLDESRRHYSPQELYQNFALAQYAQNLASGVDAQTSTGGPSGPKMGPRDTELRHLLDRIGLFRELVSGGAWTILPKPAPAAWLSLASPEKDAENLRRHFADMLRAYQAGSEEQFERSSTMARKAVEGDIPNWNSGGAQTVAVEVAYNRARPFQIAWILYLTAALLWLVTGNPGKELNTSGAVPLRNTWGRRLAMGVTGIAMLTQIIGIALRCYVAGRPPVTNMYESIIWVMLGVMVFACILYAIHRQSVAFVVSCALATIGLIAADAAPAMMDPNIHPLVPVLRSNYWLTIHVLTITLGYAAFTLTLGLADVTLYQFLRRKAGYVGRVASLNQLTYRSMQFGVVLLAAGTILGGVWADYSWGRFWGWDPKETWALIALLSYLVILHGRFTNWVGQFAFSAWTVVGFLSVLMAWYGVNFILGAGLHSYGFSSGGLIWVTGFTVLQLAYVGLVGWTHRRYQQSVQRSAASAVSGAAAAPVPGTP